MPERLRVGVVGCGNISGRYLKNLSEVFENVEVAGVADIIRERALAAAEQNGGLKVLTLEEMLADETIDIILNITPPKAHAEVALATIQAGKSVYNEKPLAVAREDGRKILDAAEKAGVRVGCAPDTVLGAGFQTCRKLIDDGWIGEPVAAAAFMTTHGPESWHPDPQFFYQVGGGPMFDMGPYYLTALVTLLGPVRRVTGSARITFPERTITSEPHYGQVMKVETPTHIAGVLDFESGAVATLVTSFDVWKSNLPRIEIYGSEGTLACPDPNTFGGPVRLMRAGGEWAQVPLSHVYEGNSRGLGVADMAAAISSGRGHRASGALGFHVLDLMHAFHDASESGAHVAVESTAARPAPLPLGLREGLIDD